MEYILLDTNIIIYREGEKQLNQDIITLSRLLLDLSDYKLCLHPLSVQELKKHKDSEQKEVILSKTDTYTILKNPPVITKEFINQCGGNNSENDYIDNSLLYAVKRDCVSYLITNDKGLRNKAKRLNLEEKVLSIEEAIQLFLKDEYNNPLYVPPVIQEEYLYNIDIDDSFFESLKNDYLGFEKWYAKKARAHEKAFVSYDLNGNIGSFLMLKIEDEDEDYSSFENPFEKGRRVKISTFKVADVGKSIGEAFVKASIEYALSNNIFEIYLTVFEKQIALINLIKEYGFELYTTKRTTKSNYDIENEMVFVKKINDFETNYPIIKLNNQNIFIIPIQDEYGHMLFPDTFKEHQLSFNDLDGTSTYSNVIKKVYISKKHLNNIKSGDILVFYFSQKEMAIKCVGVIDDVFNASDLNDFDLYKRIVKRRTVYQEDYLHEAYIEGYTTILFKHFSNLTCPIRLSTAKEQGILKTAPQSIQYLDVEKFKKIVDLSGSQLKIKI